MFFQNRGKSSKPSRQQELSIRWWEWAFSEPSATNPVLDRTGEFAHRNQPQDVFFLAGTFGTQEMRKCVVPANTEVFFPILNIFGGRFADLSDPFPSPQLKAELDRAPLEIQYIESNPAKVTGVAGNPMEMPGTSVIKSSGYWCHLEAVPAGRHHLSFAGVSQGFGVAVDYDLTVAA